MEDYFDDSRVTLGDGAVDVQQGIHGVQKVSGSRSFCRDPRLQPLAKALMDLPPRGGRPGASRPEHGVHVAPIPTDERGDPMRFCSGGHYAPFRKFGKRARNLLRGQRDGLDDYCLDCRKLQRHRHTSSRLA